MSNTAEDRSLIAALSRRWYFALACLIPLAIAGWFIGQTVGVSWRTSGSFGIVGPAVQTQPEPGTGDIIQVNVNPYAGGNGYGNFAQQIGAVLDSDSERAALERAGFSDNYEITIDQGAGIVAFDVAADDPQDALATASQLMVDAETQIIQRQDFAQVVDSLRARFSPISDPVEAEEDQTTRIQASLALAFVGILIALLLTWILDAMLLSRRSSKEEGQQLNAGTDPLDESWSESSLWDEDAMVDDGAGQPAHRPLMGKEGGAKPPFRGMKESASQLVPGGEATPSGGS